MRQTNHQPPGAANHLIEFAESAFFSCAASRLSVEQTNIEITNLDNGVRNETPGIIHPGPDNNESLIMYRLEFP